jgi:hypothetical protein
MPVIKPRTRGKQIVRHITRLDRENNETLYAYAQFLGEPTDYVLNQLIESVLAKDKEYLRWRADHSDSCVPPQTGRVRGSKRPPQSPERLQHSSSRLSAAPSPPVG